MRDPNKQTLISAEKTSQEPGLSRRTLVAAMATAAAGVATSTIANSADPSDSAIKTDARMAGTRVAASSGAVTSWDITTDVLVAGSGAAGISAAIDARRAGADVLVVEKLNKLGGSSALSGGVVYAGGGTALQKALGFEDTVESMYNYIAESGRKHPHLDKIQLYCEQSVAHFDWLVDNGVPYNKVFSASKGLGFNEASLYYSGSEEAWPWREKFKPSPRGHVPWEKGHQGGRKLMRSLLASANKIGVKALKRVAGERLVVESDGRVIGMIANVNGERKTIRAKRGVVLACGGFIHNREMVKLYAPELYDCSTPWANAGDMGMGIQMGLGAGAAALRMDQGFAIGPIYPPENTIAGIAVNANGQRFTSEEGYHAVMGNDVTYKQNGVAYFICDKDSDRPAGSDSQPLVAQANSIAELESKAGFPKGSLQMSVEYYNQYAKEGEDPLFHKSKKYLSAIDKPPFKVYDLSVDKTMYSSHTFGGLHTRPTAQVVNVWGDTIPGLYAAGRTTSGLPTSPYIASGISVGDCTFFGRQAGKNAAAEKA